MCHVRKLAYNQPVGEISVLALRIAYVSVLLFLVVLGFGGLSATASAQIDVPVVDVLRVDGTVNPSLVRYIDRGISKAEGDGAGHEISGEDPLLRVACKRLNGRNGGNHYQGPQVYRQSPGSFFSQKDYGQYGCC